MIESSAASVAAAAEVQHNAPRQRDQEQHNAAQQPAGYYLDASGELVALHGIGRKRAESDRICAACWLTRM